MIHTVSRRLQAYFGWCPNSPGVHVQARDLATEGRNPKIADPQPPQPLTIPERIATPDWMTTVALVILFATFFVGGNLWWVAFVLVVLVILVAIRIWSVRTRQGA